MVQKRMSREELLAAFPQYVYKYVNTSRTGDDLGDVDNFDIYVFEQLFSKTAQYRRIQAITGGGDSLIELSLDAAKKLEVKTSPEVKKYAR